MNLYGVVYEIKVLLKCTSSGKQSIGQAPETTRPLIFYREDIQVYRLIVRCQLGCGERCKQYNNNCLVKVGDVRQEHTDKIERQSVQYACKSCHN